jgi:ribonuclease HII
MRRAVLSLQTPPQLVLVDGCHCPKLPWEVQSIVRGDATEPAISAASILAKVVRDSQMRQLDHRYPRYGFGRHKGYPTPEHLANLRRYGPCPAHRQSFAPVRRLLHPQE